jgi:hypothetical protein
MSGLRALVLPLSFCLLVFYGMAKAQSCPKVAYTTPAATTKEMVKSVNCLVARTAVSRNETSRAETSRTEGNKSAFLIESFPVIGPQHTRSYRKIVLAILSVPTGNETRTALTTPGNPAATVAGTAGAECNLKINSDNTVDAQCNQTGGNVFVVYTN